MFCCREQINSNGVEAGGAGGEEGATAQNETGRDEEGAARSSSLPTSIKENGGDYTGKKGETGGPGFQNMVEKEGEKAKSEGKEKAEREAKEKAEREAKEKAEKMAEKEAAAATPTTTASTSRSSTAVGTRKRITAKDMNMAMRQLETIAKQPTTVMPQTIQEEQEHLQRALLQSQKDLSPEELARLWREHCQPAIECLASTGIRASMSRRPAGRDGNCLFSSLTLILNPDINEEDQQALKRALRQASVIWALERVDTLNEERFGRLQKVITNKYGSKNKEDLKRLLRNYLQDGMYEHEGGDMLPYILSAFLHRPLVVVDQHTPRQTGDDDQVQRSPVLTVIFPDLIFAPEGQIGLPLFLSRRGDHFEGLLADNGEEPNVIAFYNAERERQFTPAPSLLSTIDGEQERQQAPSVEQTATTSQTTTTGSNLDMLSTILHTSPHAILQEDTEDEDHEAQTLPTTRSNVQRRSRADQPEGKEDPYHPDCYAMGCHSKGDHRCLTCNR